MLTHFALPPPPPPPPPVPCQVVIKYVPYVGDSKRAMDEYTSEIFMGGHNTIVLHNTCEDSLLASPIIIDLVILAELCERIQVKSAEGSFERFHPVLSVLSYLLKAPMVPPGTPVVNALFRQRACIENIFRYEPSQQTYISICEACFGDYVYFKIKEC